LEKINSLEAESNDFRKEVLDLKNEIKEEMNMGSVNGFLMYFSNSGIKKKVEEKFGKMKSEMNKLVKDLWFDDEFIKNNSDIKDGYKALSDAQKNVLVAQDNLWFFSWYHKTVEEMEKWLDRASEKFLNRLDSAKKWWELKVLQRQINEWFVEEDIKDRSESNVWDVLKKWANIGWNKLDSKEKNIGKDRYLDDSWVCNSLVNPKKIHEIIDVEKLEWSASSNVKMYADYSKVDKNLLWRRVKNILSIWNKEANKDQKDKIEMVVSEKTDSNWKAFKTLVYRLPGSDEDTKYLKERVRVREWLKLNVEGNVNIIEESVDFQIDDDIIDDKEKLSKKHFWIVSTSVAWDYAKSLNDWYNVPNPLLERYQNTWSCAWYIQSVLSVIYGQEMIMTSGLQDKQWLSDAWEILPKLKKSWFVSEWDNYTKYNNVRVENNKLVYDNMNINERLSVLEDAKRMSKENGLALMWLLTKWTGVSTRKLIKSETPNSHLAILYPANERKLLSKHTDNFEWKSISDCILWDFETYINAWSEYKKNKLLLGGLDNVYILRDWNQIDLSFDINQNEFVDSDWNIVTIEKKDQLSYTDVQYADFLKDKDPKDRLIPLTAVMMWLRKEWRIPVYTTAFDKKKVTTTWENINIQKNPTNIDSEKINPEDMIMSKISIDENIVIKEKSWDAVLIKLIDSELWKDLKSQYMVRTPKILDIDEGSRDEYINKLVIRSLNYYKYLNVIQFDVNPKSKYHWYFVNADNSFAIIDWDKKDLYEKKTLKSKGEIVKAKNMDYMQNISNFEMEQDDINKLVCSYSYGSRWWQMKGQVFIHQLINDLKENRNYEVTSDMEKYLKLPIKWVWGKQTKTVTDQLLNAYKMIPSKNKLSNCRNLLYLVNNNVNVKEKYWEQSAFVTVKDLDDPEIIFYKDSTWTLHDSFRLKKAESLKVFDLDDIYDNEGRIDYVKAKSKIWPKNYVSLCKNNYIWRQELDINEDLRDNDFPKIVNFLNDFRDKFGLSSDIIKWMLQALILESGYVGFRKIAKSIASWVWYNLNSVWVFQVNVNQFKNAIKKLGLNKYRKNKEWNIDDMSIKKLDWYVNMPDRKLKRLLDGDPTLNTEAALYITMSNAYDIKKQTKFFDKEFLFKNVQIQQKKYS